MDVGCKYCGSGKGEMFMANPPFHTDKNQCIQNLREALKAFGPFHLAHTEVCMTMAGHPDPVETCTCRVKLARAALKE